jgi:hypothetical protein
MCKKLLFLVCLILLPAMGSNALAQLDPSAIDDGHVYLLEDVSGTDVPDDSANDNTGVIVGDPQVVAGIRGNALQFDGVDDGVNIPDSEFINVTGGPFPNRTVIAVFSCADVDKPEKQTVFEEGGRTRGLTIYVHEGLVYVGGWNRAEYNWNGAWLSAPITSNQWVAVALVIRDGGDAVEDDKFEMWMDGRLIDTAPGGQIYNHGNDNAIGYTLQNNVFHDDDGSGDGFYFEGTIDEVWILNQALTIAELSGFAGKPWPFAVSPSPKDGTLHEDTWVSLSWRAGGFAASHDVYFGDSFEDVNSGAEGTFQGNQTETEFIAGFPGFAVPEGLEPGTTYYWRIDEVNEAEPNSPWKGDVWSLSIPPRTAYNPAPADGAKFIDPEADLSFTAGFAAKIHTLFFGDNFEDVNTAETGTVLGDTTFDPGTLERDKTYYWRVDEFDPPTTHRGAVWSFTTAGEGGGVKAEYFSGMDLSNLVLTRVDPQINFNWGNPGSPDEDLVPVDQFSARWTGEVEAAFTETYTFYTNSDDGVRLWIDGRQLVNNWTNHAATENKGTIDLVAGNTYSLVMEYYEDGGGAVAELRWSSPRTPKELIPQAALSLPVKAGAPSPANGAVDVTQTPMLTWVPGEEADSHDVYFGTDEEAVRNADTGSPEYKGSRPLDSESYDPGELEWDTTFYWRVDEIEADGTVRTGNVWSFTTADFLIVDDMEGYNDLDPADPASNRIFNAWIDGFDDPTNGSLVGYANPPFAEQSNVHSGNQSMPFEYDNAVGISEATLTLTDRRDWTENGVDTLAIWHAGSTANAAEPMFVVLNGSAAVTNDNPDAALETSWTEWRIDLQAFADQGVNLSNVDSITLGFGNRANPVAGGAGLVFFDDIRLHRTAE